MGDRVEALEYQEQLLLKKIAAYKKEIKDLEDQKHYLTKSKRNLETEYQKNVDNIEGVKQTLKEERGRYNEEIGNLRRTIETLKNDVIIEQRELARENEALKSTNLHLKEENDKQRYNVQNRFDQFNNGKKFSKLDQVLKQKLSEISQLKLVNERLTKDNAAYVEKFKKFEGKTTETKESLTGMERKIKRMEQNLKERGHEILKLRDQVILLKSPLNRQIAKVDRSRVIDSDDEPDVRQRRKLPR